MSNKERMLDQIFDGIESDAKSDTVVRLLTPQEIEQVAGGPDHYQAPGSSHTQSGTATYWQLPGTTHNQTGRWAWEEDTPTFE